MNLAEQFSAVEWTVAFEWNVPPASLSPSFSFCCYPFCCFAIHVFPPSVLFRKHALNCHRMKPALFSVLCDIKEKTGVLAFALKVFFGGKAIAMADERPRLIFWVLS